MKFYLCSICKNLVEVIDDSGQTPQCCGRTMRELRPESTDGALEKHVPVCSETEVCSSEPKLKCVSIKVGQSPHPMTSVHHISFIVLETEHGVYKKMLLPDEDPEVCFYIPDCEQVKQIYAYCNLHGLYTAFKS